MTKRTYIRDILPSPVDEYEPSFDGFRHYVDHRGSHAYDEYNENYSHVQRVRSIATAASEQSLTELNGGMRINTRRIARAITSDGAYLVEDTDEALVSAWVMGREVAVRIHRRLLVIVPG